MTENEGFAIAAKAMSDEIDNSCLLDIMVTFNGWHMVKLRPQIPSTGIISKMLSWCQENTTGEWRTSSFGQKWAFENEQDAVMFTLRWA